MPPKRGARDLEESFSRPRTRRAVAQEAQSQPQAATQSAYHRVAVVLEEDVDSMDASVEQNLLVFVDATESQAHATKLGPSLNSGTARPSTLTLRQEDICYTPDSYEDEDEIIFDKLTFLQEVFAHSIGDVRTRIPTKRIQNTVFECLKESQSDVLTVRSYQLLRELGKWMQKFPHVRTRKRLLPGSLPELELVLNPKTWTPFDISDSDESQRLRGKPCKARKTKEVAAEQDAKALLFCHQIPKECVNWISFLKKIADCVDVPMRKKVSPEKAGQTDRDVPNDHRMKLGEFLMFKYMVELMETDLNCRLEYFEACQEAQVLQCSYFAKLLKNSEKTGVKNIFGNLQRIMYDCAEEPDRCTKEACTPFGPSVSRRDVSYLAHKLILMFMRLGTCEQDVQRCKLSDIVMDVPNGPEHVDSFLKGLDDSLKEKMEFIVAQFVRNVPKNAKIDKHAQFEDIMECMGDEAKARHFRVFDAERLEVLMGHGFQTSLLLQKRESGGKLLAGFCQRFKSALRMHQRLWDRTIDEVHRSAQFALAVAEMVQ